MDFLIPLSIEYNRVLLVFINIALIVMSLFAIREGVQLFTTLVNPKIDCKNVNLNEIKILIILLPLLYFGLEVHWWIEGQDDDFIEMGALIFLWNVFEFGALRYLYKSCKHINQYIKEHCKLPE